MIWEIGLSTGIAYRQPIGSVLGPIRQAGFRKLEISTSPEHLDLRRLERIDAIRTQIADLGLETAALHAPFGAHVDLSSPDAGLRFRSLDQLSRAADALQMLGGGIYVIHPGGDDSHWVWERDARLERSVEGLNQIWKFCRDRNLTLAIETPLPHLLGGKLSDLEWILNRLPSEGTGVCVDTSHTSLGHCLFEALDRFAPRLVHIQASDNGGVTDDHLPPGKGIIDWAAVRSKMDQIGYKGTLLFEISDGNDVAAAAIQTADAISRAFPESWERASLAS